MEEFRTCRKCGKTYSKDGTYLSIWEHGDNRCKMCVDKDNHNWVNNNRKASRLIKERWDEEHKAQIRVKRLKWETRNPTYYRDRRRKLLYGATPEQVKTLWEAQNKKCAICGVELLSLYGYDGVCVDHDHKTSRLRGLLCQRCNRRLVAIEDGDWVKRASKYLGAFISTRINDKTMFHGQPRFQSEPAESGIMSLVEVVN